MSEESYGSSDRRPSPPKTRKERYKERYEAAKSRGESFFPFTIYPDAVVSLVVFAAIVILAVFVGAETGPIADPTSTTYNPRPEWYFLFLFELLKFFPGRLEPVAVAVLPAIGIIVLLALPFFDRSDRRHPLKRPAGLALGVVVVLGIMSLTYAGYTAPLVNPPSTETPEVAAGKRVFRELGCTYCHSIGEEGGAVGPDLSEVASRLDRAAILAYLANPEAMIPESLHPKLQFTNEEIGALAAYLSTLGAAVTYSEEAPGLFAENCAACHTMDGSGGRPGPDLSRVGSFRGVEYMVAFIEDPRSVVAGATMPGFQDTLDEADIRDLAAYLYSFKGQEPSPGTGGEATTTTTHTPPTSGPEATPGEVTYARSVQPIFDAYCVACHGASGMGGLDLSNYDSATSTGDHKPLVVPGSADESILYKVLQGQVDDIPQMPPGPPLSAEDIATIGLWIDSGAEKD